MRIYVAGRTSQTENVNIVQKVAEERGHEVTHDWTGKEGGIKPDWSHHQEEAEQVAMKDRDGVLHADGVILVGHGCGQEEKGGLGCFIEVGIAIAKGLPIVVIGPCRESVFWYLPNVWRVRGYEYDRYVEAGHAVDVLHSAYLHHFELPEGGAS